jgi:uncharacterized protein (DUF2336 family)
MRSTAHASERTASPMAADGAAGSVAAQIARSGSEAQRLALAAEPRTAPELLYYLANDSAVTVRAAVAANATTPPQADRVLASDGDERVRAILGRKLAGLSPLLGGQSQDRLRRLAWDTLCRLAADTAVMVRAMIADEVKAMPDAPRALILGLAQDASMLVAEPVIRFSPLLTEEDLLALVKLPPVPETLAAVARRPQLSDSISDAIAATEDATAVTALLGNASAAIREATLDSIIAGAGAHLAWQEKLVARPSLPPRAAQALAQCVAEHLLESLAARPELDAAQSAALREAVSRRIGGGPHPGPEPAPTPAQATTLNAAGDRAGAIRLLSTRAGVAEDAVQRAVRLRSTKGLVSLCWKAGMTPRCALQAQTILAGIAPALALTPTADGGWPLREEEMAWQLDLLVNAAA